MKYARSILSSILVFTLAFSLLGGVAYASPVEEQEDDVQTQSGASQDDTQMNSQTISEEESAEIAEEANGDSSEYTMVNAADNIEYVYIDELLLAVGEEENILFGLYDDQAILSDAVLMLQRSDTGEYLLIEADTLLDNSALFKFSFDSENNAAAYVITGIRYDIEGDDASYEATFVYEKENNEYGFELVTKELKNVLSAGTNNESVSDGDATVITITDEEELVVTNSVEEALDAVIETGDVATNAENDSTQDSSSELSTFAATSAREEYLIIALDPGHGAGDSGAIGNGVLEKDANWAIAVAMKAELETYAGVSVHMVRGQNECPGLQQRVDNAVAVGADVFISLHNNSGGGGVATGSEVWVPNTSSYNYDTHVVGTALANKILEQLSKLGLYNRGVKTRTIDGATTDYYGVIRASRAAGIPGIIVEHAFVDNASDASKLRDTTFLAKLGMADALGVAQYFNLQKEEYASSIASIQYQAHVQKIGWQVAVYDNKITGTLGKALRLEAFNLKLVNQEVSGGIEYRVNGVIKGWDNTWSSDGQNAGTMGEAQAIQTVQIRLTGEMAQKYDVYYRVHSQTFGWLDWASNGASAGSDGYGYRIEAMQIQLVEKSTGISPVGDGTAFIKKTTSSDEPQIYYQAHVGQIGWQGIRLDGTMAGTNGQALPIEALIVSLETGAYSGGLQVSSQVQTYGWLDWVNSGTLSGTSGESKRAEAIRIKLTGDIANHYDIYYRTYCQTNGWLDWATNGEPAGTQGVGRRMEAIEIRLVNKTTGTAPANTTEPFYPTSPKIMYEAHVAKTGWQGSVIEGATAGTVGLARSIEALTISNNTKDVAGSIEYRTHVQTYGWQGWSSDGSVSGTTGQGKRMEAIQIRLTGALADNYDIYYRVHCQTFGWLDWACNGSEAGSAGYGYRMEAIEIKLVKKNEAAPGNTAIPYREYGASKIMGPSQTTVAQMVAYFNSSGYSYPSGTYSQYGAATINDWCRILLEEANQEGVRAEVVMCQSMKETGWLQFGNQVKVWQCNFAGIGATNGGASGADFSVYGSEGVRMGLRAQVQHLKAYASTAPLVSECVDPRFNLVTRGVAPSLEQLNGRWAVPGVGYGEGILSMINTLFRYNK